MWMTRVVTSLRHINRIHVYKLREISSCHAHKRVKMRWFKAMKLAQESQPLHVPMSRCGPVYPQHSKALKVIKATQTLLMAFLWRGLFVEIEIALSQLIWALAIEDYTAVCFLCNILTQQVVCWNNTQQNLWKTGCTAMRTQISKDDLAIWSEVINNFRKFVTSYICMIYSDRQRNV